jgi:hypothetical protein
MIRNQDCKSGSNKTMLRAKAKPAARHATPQKR